MPTAPAWNRSELVSQGAAAEWRATGAFVFVSFNHYVDDLVTYLADARDYLDLIS